MGLVAATLFVLLGGGTAQPKPVAVWDLDDDKDGLARVGEAFTVPGGVQGKALQLDGRSGYVSVPDSPGLRPAALTLAAWFKLKSVPVEHGVTVVCKPQRKAPWVFPFLSWMIRINTATQIEAAVGAGGNYGGSFAPPAPLTAGVWHHVALTYDGRVLRAYLDGAALGGETSIGAAIDYGPYPVLIGADFGADPVADFFPGQIDQVALWSAALDAAALRRVYNHGKGIGLR